MDEIDESIRREMRKFDRRFVLKKGKVTYYRIRRIGRPDDRRDGVCDQNFVKCKKSLIEEIKEVYGDESVRKVKESRMKGESKNKCEEILSEDGSIDITLDEQEQWTGKLYYRKVWLWDILLTSRRIKHLNRIILHTGIERS